MFFENTLPLPSLRNLGANEKYQGMTLKKIYKVGRKVR